MSSVTEKIQALFSLAAKNANQAEAEAALNKAIALMAKYDVSEEAVNQAASEPIIELGYTLNKHFAFKGCQSIVAMLCKHFGVFPYLKGKKEIVVIGHESKLRSCIATIDYLTGNAKANIPKGYSHTEKQGYYIGYYLAVKANLEKQVTEQPSLVLQSSCLAEYRSMAGGLEPTRNNKVKVSVNKNARAVGNALGSKANINKQIGTRALPGA
jgi:hypothetical protein